MQKSTLRNVNILLIGWGASNLYKIRLYKDNYRYKDYEVSSFNTRVFS